EIQNAGDEEIKIDTADLWSFYSYGGPTPNPDCEQCGQGGAQASGCDHCRGRYISLFPGTSFWDKREFKLNEYFAAAGKYSITTQLPYFIGDARWDSMGSNQVEFELYKCGPIENQREQL